MSLNGLGNLDASSGSINSYSNPSVSNGNGQCGPNNTNNSLNNDKLYRESIQFGNNTSKYDSHVKDWFTRCTSVNVYQSDMTVHRMLGNTSAFNVSIENDTTPYIIIPALTIDIAARYINEFDTIKNNGSSIAKTIKVIICPDRFSEREKSEMIRVNIEIIGLAEMRDIDNSMTGDYRNNYVPSSFMDKLCRTTSYKFRAEHMRLNQNNGDNTGMSMGSDLGNAINNGVNDIKNSFASIFKRKKNTTQNNTQNTPNISGFGEDIHNGG